MKKILSLVVVLALLITVSVPGAMMEAEAAVRTDEDAVASVGNNKYSTMDAALSALEKGDTLKLNQDYEGSLDIGKMNVTIDLNGHNITNADTDEYAINAFIKYGDMKADAKISVINSSDKEASIISDKIANFKSGNSLYVIEGYFGENVKLVTDNKNAITLNYAYLQYSDEAAGLVNGGFKAKNENGEFIYGTASDAMEADSNKTAMLLSDYEGPAPIAMGEGEEGTIDLNGHTYKVTTKGENAVKLLHKNSNLTIKNGTLLDSGTVNSENAMIDVFDSAEPYDGGITLTLENVKMETSSHSGIRTQGLNKNITVTLKNCELTVNTEDGMGIYFPSAESVLTVENSVIKAGTGIGVKGGKVILKDTEINAVGKANIPEGPEGSGIANTGDAIYVEGNYGFGIEIEVTGGKYLSYNGEAVNVAFDEDEEAIKEIAIKSGIFSTIPEKGFIKADIIAKHNDNFVLGGEEYVQEAVSDAASGDNIEILSGSVELELGGGVTVTNSGDGQVTANGEKVDEVSVVTHAHNAVKVEAKEPTATEDGNIEYWYCEGCGKYFSNAESTDEIELADTVIPATGEPTEPTDPTNPAVPSEKPDTPAGDNEENDNVKDDADKSETPKTGDSSLLALYVMLMLSSFGLAGTLAVSKRKN